MSFMKRLLYRKQRFMSKPLVICLLLLVFISKLTAQNDIVELSFEQALNLMNQNNKSLKIAQHQIDWAKTERQGINSFWYPKINIVGAYTIFSNDIEVRESLSQFTSPIKDYIHSVDPNEQAITGILNEVGQNTFSVPLMPNNIASIDAVVTLPIFTGGKRMYASKIGKQMEQISQVSKQRVGAEQQALLVEAYYGVRLGQKIVEVKRETYNSFEKHYQNALKLEANGMLNKAERLFFEVNRDEAKRELEVAQKDLIVTENAFKTLVNIESEKGVVPTSSLFINESLPEQSYFKSLIVDNNYIVSALNIQKNIQNNQIKIANSSYIPNIELIGKQTLFSHGIDKYLVPRSMIGVGFTWNIFDGFDREKQVKQAKIAKSITEVEQAKAIDDLNLAVDKLYSQTQIALDNVKALKTTIEMSKELVRTRQKAFVEGMATSTEVIDAELMLSKVRLTSLLAYFQFDVNLINLLAICGMPESFYQYSQEGLTENHVLN